MRAVRLGLLLPAIAALGAAGGPVPDPPVSAPGGPQYVYTPFANGLAFYLRDEDISNRLDAAAAIREGNPKPVFFAFAHGDVGRIIGAANETYFERVVSRMRQYRLDYRRPREPFLPVYAGICHAACEGRMSLAADFARYSHENGVPIRLWAPVGNHAISRLRALAPDGTLGDRILLQVAGDDLAVTPADRAYLVFHVDGRGRVVVHPAGFHQLNQEIFNSRALYDDGGELILPGRTDAAAPPGHVRTPSGLILPEHVDAERRVVRVVAPQAPPPPRAGRSWFQTHVGIPLTRFGTRIRSFGSGLGRWSRATAGAAGETLRQNARQIKYELVVAAAEPLLEYLTDNSNFLHNLTGQNENPFPSWVVNTNDLRHLFDAQQVYSERVTDPTVDPAFRQVMGARGYQWIEDNTVFWELLIDQTDQKLTYFWDPRRRVWRYYTGSGFGPWPPMTISYGGGVQHLDGRGVGMPAELDDYLKQVRHYIRNVSSRAMTNPGALRNLGEIQSYKDTFCVRLESMPNTSLEGWPSALPPPRWDSWDRFTGRDSSMMRERLRDLAAPLIGPALPPGWSAPEPAPPAFNPNPPPLWPEDHGHGRPASPGAYYDMVRFLLSRKPPPVDVLRHLLATEPPGSPLYEEARALLNRMIRIEAMHQAEISSVMGNMLDLQYGRFQQTYGVSTASPAQPGPALYYSNSGYLLPLQRGPSVNLYGRYAPSIHELVIQISRLQTCGQGCGTVELPKFDWTSIGEK